MKTIEFVMEVSCSADKGTRKQKGCDEGEKYSRCRWCGYCEGVHEEAK